MATNAYSGEFSKSLVPDIAREVMPVLSWQMATQPLSDNIRKTIIPGRQAMSDTMANSISRATTRETASSPAAR